MLNKQISLSPPLLPPSVLTKYRTGSDAMHLVMCLLWNLLIFQVLYHQSGIAVFPVKKNGIANGGNKSLPWLGVLPSITCSSKWLLLWEVACEPHPQYGPSSLKDSHHEVGPNCSNLAWMRGQTHERLLQLMPLSHCMIDASMMDIWERVVCCGHSCHYLHFWSHE